MYHFIVNPTARSGLGLITWEKVEARLKEEKIEYTLHFTQRRHDATRIAAGLTAGGEEITLVVLGGDGSVDEVVNGICFPDKVTLGYVPLGSGNDFGRGLGLPSRTLQALDTVLHSELRRTLNLGLVSYGQKKHRFAVSSGIGYDAAITHQVCVSRLKRFLNRFGLGKFVYVGASLYRLYHCRPDGMTVTLDDSRTLHFKKAYFAAAFNLPYEGGGCKFCPDARPDDDLLDVIVIADVPKIAALLILPTVFAGKHTHLKGVHIFRCRKAEIESALPLPVHADGEPIYLQRAVQFSLERESIHVITNKY